MVEEIKKSYNPFMMWGSWAGLILILLIIPMANYQNDLSVKEHQWERYNLCKPCGEPRNLTCVIELCEKEVNKMGRQEYIDISCSHHPDIENNHPEAFINGFCGYDLWEWFGYGKKPNKILTYFSPHNYKRLGGMSIFGVILVFLTIVSGFLIGWGIHSLIRKYKR